MTEKRKCCVRACDARDTHEHRGKGTNNLGQSVHFIVRVCDACRKELAAKEVNYTFYRAGSLVFVEEIF